MHTKSTLTSHQQQSDNWNSRRFIKKAETELSQWDKTLEMPPICFDHYWDASAPLLESTEQIQLIAFVLERHKVGLTDDNASTTQHSRSPW